MTDPLDEALAADPELVDEQDPELLAAMAGWRELIDADLPTITPKIRR